MARAVPVSGPPTLLLCSGLKEEAAALDGLARGVGWSVIDLSQLPDDVEIPSASAFYGDSVQGPALVVQRRVELLEPAFDLLVQLPAPMVRRRLDYGNLGLLVTRHGAGFFKPADACNKAFSARVYDPAGAAGLLERCEAHLLALHSEPVRWASEFRLAVHRGAVLSVACYKIDGRRPPNPLQAALVSEEACVAAQTFAQQVLRESGIAWPPAFILDVGYIADRGWAVVEVNPFWCARFFGVANTRYLHALSDIIFSYGTVPAALRHWAVRSHRAGND